MSTRSGLCSSLQCRPNTSPAESTPRWWASAHPSATATAPIAIPKVSSSSADVRRHAAPASTCEWKWSRNSHNVTAAAKGSAAACGGPTGIRNSAAIANNETVANIAGRCPRRSPRANPTSIMEVPKPSTADACGTAMGSTSLATAIKCTRSPSAMLSTDAPASKSTRNAASLRTIRRRRRCTDGCRMTNSVTVA